MKIKAAVVRKQKKDIQLEELVLDEIKPNEVLIKTVSSGICHTDLAGRDQGMSPYPVALGHEGTGVVEKVGSAVTSVKPGDHVITSFSYCGRCKNCLSGHPGLCEKLNHLNFDGVNYDETHRLHTLDGEDVSVFFGQSSLANYMAVDEHNIVKVSNNIDLKLIGPLACGFQTGSGTVLNYLKPKFGSNIVIAGAGSVGLAAIMAAKIINCNHIIAIDIHDNRLVLAKELGATEVINSKDKDVVKEINSIVTGGVDYAIDTTGYSPIVLDLLHSICTAGICMVIGIGGDIQLNLMNDILGESKKLIGLVEGDSIPQLFIPKLINYYQKGLFPFNKLVKYYKFDEINQAIEDMTSEKIVKPIITFD